TPLTNRMNQIFEDKELLVFSLISYKVRGTKFSFAKHILYNISIFYRCPNSQNRVKLLHIYPVSVICYNELLYAETSNLSKLKEKLSRASEFTRITVKACRAVIVKLRAVVRKNVSCAWQHFSPLSSPSVLK